MLRPEPEAHISVYVASRSLDLRLEEGPVMQPSGSFQNWWASVYPNTL